MVRPFIIWQFYHETINVWTVRFIFNLLLMLYANAIVVGTIFYFQTILLLKKWKLLLRTWLYVSYILSLPSLFPYHILLIDILIIIYCISYYLLFINLCWLISYIIYITSNNLKIFGIHQNNVLKLLRIKI